MYSVYLTTELNELYNKQRVNEVRNSEVYRAISSFFKDKQLLNLAKKFEQQMEEELEHAKKFTDMINDRVGSKYISMTIPEISFQLNSIDDCVNAYVELEKMTAEEISMIYDKIIEQKSYLDLNFIEEMLHIQIEETDGADHFKKNYENATDILIFDQLFAE